jgi:cytidylate kinase
VDDRIRSFIFAVDGPSGSGKSTTARLVARRLGLRHIDTGAMYRAVTLCAREAGIDPGDGVKLGSLARGLAISIVPVADAEPRVRVGERDVTAEIRSPDITAAVSAVSAHPDVRAAMVKRQRELSAEGGVILEGRDIGSVVLPWADVKIYLDASLRVRAERRHAELVRAGTATNVEDIERDLLRRDTLDASREASPLVCPVGAWVVDTSNVTIDEEVQRVIDLADEAVRERSDGARVSQRKRFVYRSITTFVAAVYHVVFGMRVRRILRAERGQNYLFASNHRAYSDPPAVSCRLPREVHFVAKDSLFKVPVLGPLIRYLNAFPIRREMFDREAMAHAVKVLNTGGSVLIFPEGGRIRGRELGTARSGVGYLAIQTGAPVVPCFVEGTNHLHLCLFRLRRFRVIQGRPIWIPRALAEEYRRQDDRSLYRRHSEMVLAAIRALRDGAP